MTNNNGIFARFIFIIPPHKHLVFFVFSLKRGAKTQCCLPAGPPMPRTENFTENAAKQKGLR
jgi:hypothetical protein